MTLLVGSIFHMTRKIVSEMTYNVSMGTLNPTIPIPIPVVCVDGVCRTGSSFTINSPDLCSLGPNVTLITLNTAGICMLY